jgi:hypothetical protein
MATRNDVKNTWIPDTTAVAETTARYSSDRSPPPTEIQFATTMPPEREPDQDADSRDHARHARRDDDRRGAFASASRHQAVEAIAGIGCARARRP